MQKFWQSVYSRRMPQKTAWLLAFWWACCTLRESKKSKGSFSLGSLAKSSSKLWVWECRAGGKKMDVGQSFWSSIERAKSSKNSKPGTCWCKRTPQSLSFSFRVCLFSDKLYWCASRNTDFLLFFLFFFLRVYLFQRAQLRLRRVPAVTPRCKRLLSLEIRIWAFQSWAGHINGSFWQMRGPACKMFVDLTMWELQCEFKVEFVPTAAIQAAGGAGL